jgi:hypothetical protein
MRLVCVLRNPIDRAYSHWNMERSHGADDRPFGEAIRHETERCWTARPFQHRVYSYMDRGLYSEQVRRLWRFFPRDQTLFLRSEELRAAPQDTLDRVCDFIGVGRMPVSPRVEHSLEYPAPMEPSDREYLASLFQWEIRELERLLGWDCRRWLDPA